MSSNSLSMGSRYSQRRAASSDWSLGERLRGSCHRPCLPFQAADSDGLHVAERMAAYIFVEGRALTLALTWRACSDRGSTGNCSRRDVWQALADNFRRLPRSTTHRNSPDGASCRSPTRISYAASLLQCAREFRSVSLGKLWFFPQRYAFI